MAKLYFRYGAMGSSKSANALMVNYNYIERGQNALLIKPGVDTRDGADIIMSRMGLTGKCTVVPKDQDLCRLDLFKQSGEPRYQCLIIDEAQFLTKDQVCQLVKIVDEYKIPVICYGLRTDFQGNLFEGSHWLIAWADTIEEIKTICWCGKKAIMTARIANGKVVKEGEQIVLGANENYTSLCRPHWTKNILGKDHTGVDPKENPDDD
jgi:thymidine kinase